MVDISDESSFRGGCFCDVYFCPGGQIARCSEVSALLVFCRSLGGLTGFLTAVQNEKEWIISNTAETNSTNLSFSSCGSRFALSAKGMERGEEGRREKGEEDS